MVSYNQKVIGLLTLRNVALNKLLLERRYQWWLLVLNLKRISSNFAFPFSSTKPFSICKLIVKQGDDFQR